MIRQLQEQFIKKCVKVFNDALIDRDFNLEFIRQYGNDIVDISSGKEMVIARISSPEFSFSEGKYTVSTQLIFITPVPYIRVPND